MNATLRRKMTLSLFARSNQAYFEELPEEDVAREEIFEESGLCDSRLLFPQTRNAHRAQLLQQHVRILHASNQKIRVNRF